MASVTRARRCRAAGAALLGAIAATAVLAAMPLGDAGAAPRDASVPPVRLLHQSPVVRSPGGALSISLSRTGPAAAAGATVTLILYSRLTTRSELMSAIGAPGPSNGVSATPAIAASCLAGGNELHLRVGVAPDGAALRAGSQCGAPTPILRLGCSAACDGVYPLRIIVYGGGQAAAMTTLVTFAARATMPLRFCWVLRVAGPRGALAQAVPVLEALRAHPRVAATLDVEGSAISARHDAPAEEAAVSLISATTAVKSHELIAEPYVPADLGALHASALRTEVIRQFALSDVALDEAGILAQPTGSATYGTGPQTPTMAEAVASVRIRHLIVDGAALATDPSTTLSWGAAFHIAGASPDPAAVLATDTELGQLSDSTVQDPALSAAQFLGELAFLHFEQPNLPDPRAAVVVTTATSLVTTAFVDQVLAGVSANPVIRPVTTSGAFAQVRVGANGFPPVEPLALGPSAPFPAPTVREINFLRVTTDALSSAVLPGGESPIPSIEGELLSAEQVLPQPVRSAMLADVHYRLEQEVGHFHIDNGSITLTELTGSIPITILSNAPYSVRGTLLFGSSKLSFPAGAVHTGVHVIPPVGTAHQTVHAPTTGDLPLTVLFVSPDRRIVLARAEIVVRATPISWVGVALTVGAIVVLVLWWVRTSMRRRSQRA